MHIVHYILTEQFAGSERYCADLANYQSAQGHRVSIVSHPRAKLADHLDPDIRFCPITRWQSRFGGRGFFAALKPDIIHAHLGRAARYLKSVPHPRIATLHVKYKPKDHDHMDGLIALNGAQMGRLAQYRGQKTEIGNWITPLPPASPQAMADIKTAYHLDPSDFIFGFVGRLNAAKRVELLIDCFNDVLNNASDALRRSVKLLIIGDGEDMAHLKARAGSPHIIFTGQRQNLANYYQLIDCLVLPSNNEAFPLVLGEAMSCGCHIIATATEGARACLGENADLVPIGDRLALSTALKQALIEYSPKARAQHDIRHLDRATQCQKISTFYGRVIADHKL